MQNIKENLNKLEDFQHDILTKSIRDSVYNEFWEDIFDDYDILKMSMTIIDGHCLKMIITFQELIVEDTLFILEEIIATNKEIPVNWINGLIKPKWKR